MTAAEIETQEDLKAWLESQSREVCVWIAARAAARVLPIYLKKIQQKKRLEEGDVTALLICRPIMSAYGFSAAEDDANKTDLAASADSAATMAAGGFAVFNADYDTYLADLVVINAADATHEAAFATTAAEAISAASTGARAAAFEDARWAEAVGIATPRPLWPEGMPEEIADAWQATLEAVNAGVKSGHGAAQKKATLGLGVTRATRRRPVSRALQIACG